MPIPSLQGLQTALSGLMANQEALDVTGQNIANASTPGYSRQEAVMETNQPLVIPGMLSQGRTGQLGTGVGVGTIARIRDTYLDAQYRTQNAALGAATTQSSELQQAQSAFDEPSSSAISGQLSAFWSAWSELADSPSSEAAREGVVSSGSELATSLNQLSAQLSTLSTQAEKQYASLVGPGGTVQEDATQIALLNRQISSAEQAGQTPNNLLDSRDELLDQLSGLAQISVTQNPDGADTVSLAGVAKPLVEGATVNWPQTLTAAVGGRLGALLELTSPTGTLAGYQAALNGVASELETSVNSLQPTTPFFTGGTAATIAVAATPAQIQTSSTGSVGGNDLAQSVAALRGGAAEQSYTALVEQLGSDVKTAQNDETTDQAVVTAIENQRQSVSGVSMDEEMTNMVSFQSGYQASARVLTTMDQVLETLIEHTGVVGL